MPATLVIVGRPNVGKSTLFNRLIGARAAVVDPTPGVTRDFREGAGKLGDLAFRLIDTAGVMETAPRGSLEARMVLQTERALEGATLALFVVDARAGVTPEDEAFARWLKRLGLKAILVANKCEGEAGAVGQMEAWKLGFGTPVPVSAEHGEGMALLYEVIQPIVDAVDPEDAKERVRPIKLAIVGRPNVGKSTLVNTLLGRERVLTGPEPGITRDAIATRWRYGEREIELVDTAGMRRRTKIEERVERLAVADTLHTIRFAEVVVLLLDALEGVDRQDLTIGRMVIEEGRALVVAANKWDAVADRAKVSTLLRERISDSLAPAAHRLVQFSARTGENLDQLMPAVLDAYAAWNLRIPTPKLNDWLADMVARHSPPLDPGGRRIKLRYLSQTGIRPPTVTIFGNRPGALPGSYLRFLENGLRKEFDFGGAPVRLQLRRGKNPYAKGD
ncbi:MAG: ribosome biogenesis GTPase Der [Alphaproteobacteria bacterium]|nr:ribosome biogenesis GTPase Der [Alphaproteobacteria bacterium]